MSFWSKLAGFVGGVVTGPVGIAASAAPSIAREVSDIVEKWAPGVEKKQELSEAIHKAITSGVAEARAFAAPGTHDTWFDVVVDGLNRLVRPVITFGMIGGLWGMWPLPTTGTIEPIVLYWIGALFTFWFGARTILKDIPEVILYLKNVRRS